MWCRHDLDDLQIPLCGRVFPRLRGSGLALFAEQALALMRPCRVLGSQPQKLGGRVRVARCFRQAGKHVRLPPVVVGIGHRNWAFYQA